MNASRELLHDALDGRLDAARLRAFERRLREDPAFRAEWEELRRFRDLLGRVGVEAPPVSVSDAVRARIAAEGTPPRKSPTPVGGEEGRLPSRRPLLGVGFLRAAAVLIALCLVVPILVRERDRFTGERGASEGVSDPVAEASEEGTWEGSGEDFGKGGRPGEGAVATDPDATRGREKARYARAFRAGAEGEEHDREDGAARPESEAPPASLGRPEETLGTGGLLLDTTSSDEAPDHAVALRLHLRSMADHLQGRLGGPPADTITMNYALKAPPADPARETMMVVLASMDRLSDAEIESDAFRNFASDGDRLLADASSAPPAPSREVDERASGAARRGGMAEGPGAGARGRAPGGPGGGPPSGPARPAAEEGAPAEAAEPEVEEAEASEAKADEPRQRRRKNEAPGEAAKKAAPDADEEGFATGGVLRFEESLRAREARPPERRFYVLSGPDAVQRAESFFAGAALPVRRLDVETAFGRTESEAERPAPDAVDALPRELAPSGYRVLELRLPPASLDTVGAALEDLRGLSLRVLATRAAAQEAGKPPRSALVLLVLDR